MKHAKLLDCTLRDGAYLVDKTFGDTVIRGIISGLMDAGIDWIEIGFLQDEGYGEGKTVFKNAADAERFIPEKKGECQFAVLADYSRYTIDNLDDYSGRSIDAVRECFYKSERYDAIDACKKIKQKGYRLFVQPVDILGYSDFELIEFISLINEVEPYCLSIVDTFGSMYQEDLHRIFALIDHNLIKTCKIGFHSHNNMQLSNALSQEFLRISSNQRRIIIDGTMAGMGRGAGNTPTELVAHYMVDKMGYSYNVDALLDVIDGYMDNIQSRCSWGYNAPYFIAGAYGAHVNNVAYLKQKNSIRSKDIRYILNNIGLEARKRYDYDLLEEKYLELMQSDIDDSNARMSLANELNARPVLILVPGNSINSEQDKIIRYIKKYNPIVISVNFIDPNIKSDYIYMNNVKRYRYWNQNKNIVNVKKILTSNIIQEKEVSDEIIVSFVKLIKCGWEHSDNSTIMLLRLLDGFEVKSIAIAGFDGYSCDNPNKSNYMSDELELSSVKMHGFELNEEIGNMLSDYMISRKNQKVKLYFVTESRFEQYIERES